VYFINSERCNALGVFYRAMKALKCYRHTRQAEFQRVSGVMNQTKSLMRIACSMVDGKVYRPAHAARFAYTVTVGPSYWVRHCRKCVARLSSLAHNELVRDDRRAKKIRIVFLATSRNLEKEQRYV